MRYLIMATSIILVFVVSCEISTKAYEATLLEACGKNNIVTLLKTKTVIDCKIIK